MATSSNTLDVTIPTSWEELTDSQLKMFYRVMAAGIDTMTAKVRIAFTGSGLALIGQLQDMSGWLVGRQEGKKKQVYKLTTLQVAQMVERLRFLDEMPAMPVRPAKIARRKAVAADFEGVPFQDFLFVESCYQGYLKTENPSFLDEMTNALLNCRRRLSNEERMAVFFWVTGLKQYLAVRYPDLFKPADEAADGNLLGAPNPADKVGDSINAMLRALTGGDPTKEELVLALDTHRALTELDAQARESAEISRKYGKS